jgi:hypothetical protein
MQIFSPQELNDITAARFINEIWRAKDEDSLIMNFSTLQFVYPSGVLISAIGIRHILRYRSNNGLKTQTSGTGKYSGAISYLGHFGFFQFIGIDVGNKPNEAQGGRNFLPITRIDKEEFNNKHKVIQEQITKKSYDLASVLYPNKSDISKVDMLAFCLRETMRNVFEHAEVEKCYVMAQRWRNGNAEIAIADEGIGIPVSLSKSHKILSPRSAIRLAIQPGISANTKKQTDDKWENTGFGLYVLSEVGNACGSFTLLSDCNMLVREGSNDTWVPSPVNGTIVKLRVTTNHSDYFPNILQNIVATGEREAETIPGAIKSASKGSKKIDPIQW